MKTSFRKKMRILFSIFLTGCFLFLTVSCGLDQFFYVEGPSVVINSPTEESFYDNREFRFETNEVKMDDDSYIGTDVYYKIFVNKDQCESVRNNLNNKAQTEPYSSAQIMIDTYKFLPLGKTGSISAVLVPKTGVNREVKIRLTNYNDTDYSAHIIVNNSLIGIPQRNGNVGDVSFDFGNRSGDENANKNRLPVIGDVDLYTTDSATPGNEFYVCLYAVALRRDVTNPKYYSKILYLGTVLIDSNNVNN